MSVSAFPMPSIDFISVQIPNIAKLAKQSGFPKSKLLYVGRIIIFVLMHIYRRWSRQYQTGVCYCSRLSLYLFVMFSKKTKDIVTWTLSVAVAVFLLYFSFRGVKWEDFLAALQGCKWGYVFVAMAASIAAFYFRAARWRELILPLDASMDRMSVFNAINICYVVNMVLPRVGEFVRCGFITRNSEFDAQGHRKASYDKVLGTAVVDRLWDIVTMFLLLLVFLAIMWDRFGNFFKEKIFPSASGEAKGIVIVLVLVALLVGIYFIIKHFRFKSKVCAKIYGVLEGLWNGITSCLRMESGWKFLFYTVLIWLMYWLMSWGVLLAVKDTNPDLANLGVVDALFLMIAGALSSLIPVPGGFGAFHYVVALAVSSVYGCPFELGIIFATLSHESQVFTEILFGGGSYVHEMLRKRPRRIVEEYKAAHPDAAPAE